MSLLFRSKGGMNMQRGSRSRQWTRRARRGRTLVLHRAGGQLVIIQWLVRSRYGVMAVVQKVEY